MANKKPTILAVDKSTSKVQFTEAGSSRVRELPFGILPKMGKIATIQFIGLPFTGKPPMHHSDAELNAKFSAWRGVPQPEAPKVPTPQPEAPKVETPKVPTPKENPMPTTTSLDDALKVIVEGVLATYKPEISPEEIRDMVGEANAHFTTEIRSALDKVQELATVVANRVPKVTEIHLANREIRKIDGVTHFQFTKVLGAMSQGVHMMLVGPAGTGKSTIAENASTALGLEFSSKSCTSQTSEASLTGYMNATGDYVGTEFRQRFQNGGVFLLDEIDNANPNVLGVLNSALANGFMAFPDGMVKRHPEFVAIAAGNTFGNGATAEYVGRNPIDAATKDRFAVFGIDYDLDIEQAMLDSVGLPTEVANGWLKAVRKARANVESYGLKVVVSPRATLNGARLIKSGSFSMAEVMDACILKGAKSDQAVKILEGVAL